jgi:hypothetical protein
MRSFALIPLLAGCPTTSDRWDSPTPEEKAAELDLQYARLGAAITVEVQGEKASLNGVKTYNSVAPDSPALPPGWTVNDAAIARLAMEKAKYEAEKAKAELELAKMEAAALPDR